MKPDYIWKINTNLFKGKDGWKKGSATPMSHDQDRVTWSRFFSISKGKRVPQIFPPFSAAETNTSITGHHTCHINLNKHLSQWYISLHFNQFDYCTCQDYHWRYLSSILNPQPPPKDCKEFSKRSLPHLASPTPAETNWTACGKMTFMGFLNVNQFDYHTLQNDYNR